MVFEWLFQMCARVGSTKNKAKLKMSMKRDQCNDNDDSLVCVLI